MNGRYSTRLIRTYRITRVVIHTLFGMLIAATYLSRVSKGKREAIISRWSHKLLAIMNIHVNVYGTPPDADISRVMFIANHISWIDIHALNSVRAVRFVAKSEVRNWPILGWLAQSAGTIFITREKRQEVGRIVKLAANALREDDCLCIFPEGTTTDGTEIKAFKGGLTQAAIDAEANIWPVAICYPNADGSVNTEMAYYGDISLLQSMKQIFALRASVIELHFLPVIPPQGHDRQTLSRLVRESIVFKLDLPG